MLSRVADHVYWMSRYLGRAASIARFVDVNFRLMLDLPGLQGNHWSPLIEVTGDHDFFNASYPEATRENVMQFLTFDRTNPNSIVSCLVTARENAHAIRDTLPEDLWEEINALYHFVIKAEERGGMHKAIYSKFYEDMARYGALVGGVAQDSMTEGEGWHFFRLGRMLERADKTSRMLDVKYFILLPDVDYVGSPYDDIQWSALLRSLGAFEVFRRTYRKITPESVVRFLVLDPAFPRSIRYCLNKADESLRALTGTQTGWYANDAERRSGQLCADLGYMQTETIFHAGVHEFIDTFQASLNQLDTAIYETFFSLHPSAATQNQP